MSVIGSNILAGASGQAGYNLTKSLRFRSSASAYLNRTPASAGNTQKFTISVWYKAGKIGVDPVNANIINAGGDGSSLLISGTGAFGATYNDRLLFREAGTTLFYWDRVFRDPSAWYHIVFAMDTTQATAANRAKLYVNGVDQGAFSGTAITQNTSTSINNNTAHYINLFNSAYYHSDLYYAEYNLIDGQALTPSSFGETSTSTGVWIPKKYTGTYGTNGFYLPFTDTTSTSTLGTDFSGNSNTWTVNNISLTSGSTYDSMNDVPTLTSATTANYATLNPISNPNGTIVTYSDGNLAFSHSASSGNAPKMTVQSTMALPAGKTYWEYTVGATVNDQLGIGTMLVSGGSADGTAGARYLNNGTFQSSYTNPSTAASYTTNDVIGMAYDQPNGTLTFYKNNSLQGTITNISTSEVFFAHRSVNSSGTGGAGVFNFGQRPFTYTPPTGFVALNTFNLPTPTIGATASTTANKYFDINLWTGTGTTNVITNSGSMQPDFVWAKRRSSAASHGLVDSVRGTGKTLFSNLTDAEDTGDSNLTAFNSNGFTAGSGGNFNTSGQTYVGWQWRASNATAVTNTAGSIISTVSANTTAGFSVVTYTGNGTAGATVGHGLGVAPSMVIVKKRSGVADWPVQHISLGPNASLRLNGTDATANEPWWNSTAPSSTVFTLGSSNTINQSSETFVAYCFSAVAGYSAFGSYTGNDSADGTFIYTGFRPAFVLYKKANGIDGWLIYDAKRNTYNVADALLQPNTSGAEAVSAAGSIDILSNGFKQRNANNIGNSSSFTYIYMAFAEHPFKYANAR